MIITEIKQQKNNTDRCSVFLDNEFAFGIDNFDLYALKLKVGMEISEEELRKIKETVLFSSAKEYAVNLISRFTYTKKAIYNKLKNKEYDDSTIEKTIIFLEEYNFINDYDYAKRFINDSLKIKHWGTKKIKYELNNKGIDENIIVSALSEFDFDELESDCVLSIARKKFSGNFEYKNIMKVKRFLVSKGFSYEIIDKTINQLIQENGE